MISEKIKSWLPKKEKESEKKLKTIEHVSVDDFEEVKKEEKKDKKKEVKMAPEVKAEVRERDVIKRDGDGKRVPSYL